MSFTHEDILAARRELSRRSLASFVRLAWSAIEPNTYVHGRHVDLMAEHLEAVHRGEIRRLIINVPPGTMKSTLCGVFFPMWLWGPQGKPGTRFVGLAHEQSLGIRDNVKCRRLVASPWYQQLWGEQVALTKDQNEKLNFENTAGGFRQVATTSNVTGRRGDIVICDDPLSAENANREAEREKVNLWFQESLPTRMNDPEKSAIIVVMQRLHERDPTGFITGENWGWEHLMLPMRFEEGRRFYTSAGTDWRTKEGELLFPERFPEHVVSELEKTMGAYASAGQLQQRPAPRDGGLFKRSWFKPIGAVPSGGRRYVRAWDFAATAKNATNNPDYTAGVLMSRGAEGDFLIHSVDRFRGTPRDVKAAVKHNAAIDGRQTTIRIAQDPGQAGKDQAETYIRDLAGYTVNVVRPTGEKATRAAPLAVQAEAGNLSILRTGNPDEDAWIEPFMAEMTLFPAASHDDQVDAAADAFSEIALGSTYNIDAWG
jgi:predicted phage terminase large subunit-like protein